MLGIDYKLEVK